MKNINHSSIQDNLKKVGRRCEISLKNVDKSGKAHKYRIFDKVVNLSQTHFFVKNG